MFSLRYVFLNVTFLFVLAFSGNSFAADPTPGSACTGANRFVRSGGPETSGVVNDMTCQSSVWVPTLTYMANSNIGIGTTNPTTKLDVNGRLLATGAIGSREVANTVAAGATFPASGGIDMTTGNVFTFNASAAGACSTVKVDLTTMTAGVAYTLGFVGYNSGTCSIQDQTGATTNIKFYGGLAPSISSAQDVVCSAVRVGTKLYVSCLTF